MAKKQMNSSSLLDQVQGDNVQTASMVTPAMEMEQKIRLAELQEKDREIEARLAKLPESQKPKTAGYQSQMIRTKPGNNEPDQPSLTARYAAKDYDVSKLSGAAKARYDREMKWVRGKFFSLADSKKLKNAVSCNISKWGISEDHTFVHGMTYVVRAFVAEHLNSLKMMIVDTEMQNLGKDSRNGVSATNFGQNILSEEPIYQFVIQDYVDGAGIMQVDSNAPKRLIGVGGI